jgi:hypothetical protein
LYERVYFDIGVSEPNIPDMPEKRYVLDVDMVDIGTSELCKFKHIATTIKRLKFERENNDIDFYDTESHRLRNFTDAKEIYVV